MVVLSQRLLPAITDAQAQICAVNRGVLTLPQIDTGIVFYMVDSTHHMGNQPSLPQLHQSIRPNTILGMVNVVAVIRTSQTHYKFLNSLGNQGIYIGRGGLAGLGPRNPVQGKAGGKDRSIPWIHLYRGHRWPPDGRRWLQRPLLVSQGCETTLPSGCLVEFGQQGIF